MMSDYFNFLLYSGNAYFLSLLRALTGSSLLFSASQGSLHTSLQHHNNFVSLPSFVFTSVTYAQPSLFGRLTWYDRLPQPKVNRESESKSKYLMLSPELRMELISNSFQPLKEDNRCLV